MQVTGAIFDLDGTLIDSMRIWDQLAEQYLLQNGVTPESGVREAVKTMSLEESVAYFKKYYGMTKAEAQMIEEINEAITLQYEEKIPLKEGAKEFLEELKKRNVKMCIATATDKTLVTMALRRLEIIEFFEGILTCSEVGKSKEYPDIYDEALKMLKTDRETTLVFEDAYHAIHTAKSAGYVVVGVKDQSEAINEDRIRKEADFYVESLTEMEKQIDEESCYNSRIG